MNDSLISRAAAIEEIARRDTTNGTVKVYSGLEVNAILNELPAVDAVPRVSAHWRTLKDGSLECTNCFGISPHDENYNGDIIFNYETDYCPWCGAKMDGERRDSE